MDWIMMLLLICCCALSFIMGVAFATKDDDQKTYKDVKLLNADLFDANSINYQVERFENEGYHYCKDACYENILVFVKEEEEK